jgi:glycosyltransferase involved in cell wall biosynthesis
MATGVPLVGTDVGVMPDLLEPEALFPAGDVDAMALRIRAAMTDPDLPQALREGQRRRMADLSEREFLRRTLAVYEGLR